MGGRGGGAGWVEEDGGCVVEGRWSAVAVGRRSAVDGRWSKVEGIWRSKVKGRHSAFEGRHSAVSVRSS